MVQNEDVKLNENIHTGLPLQTGMYSVTGKLVNQCVIYNHAVKNLHM